MLNLLFAKLLAGLVIKRTGQNRGAPYDLSGGAVAFSAVVAREIMFKELLFQVEQCVL